MWVYDTHTITAPAPAPSTKPPPPKTSNPPPPMSPQPPSSSKTAENPLPPLLLLTATTSSLSSTTTTTTISSTMTVWISKLSEPRALTFSFVLEIQIVVTVVAYCAVLGCAVLPPFSFIFLPFFSSVSKGEMKGGRLRTGLHASGRKVSLPTYLPYTT